MSATLVQTVASANANADITLNPTGTKRGSLLVLGGFIASTSATISSITDNAFNTWTKIFLNVGNTAQGTELWYARNTTGVSEVIVHYAVGGANRGVIFREYSGMMTSLSVLDRTTNTSGSAASMTTSASTITRMVNELVIVVGYSSGGGASLTAGSGYGNMSQMTPSTGSLGMEDKIVSSLATQTGTMTSSVNSQYEIGLATFGIDAPSPFISSPIRQAAFTPGLAR